MPGGHLGMPCASGWGSAPPTSADGHDRCDLLTAYDRTHDQSRQGSWSSDYQAKPADSSSGAGLRLERRRTGADAEGQNGRGASGNAMSHRWDIDGTSEPERSEGPPGTPVPRASHRRTNTRAIPPALVGTGGRDGWALVTPSLRSGSDVADAAFCGTLGIDVRDVGHSSSGSPVLPPGPVEPGTRNVETGFSTGPISRRADRRRETRSPVPAGPAGPVTVTASRTRCRPRLSERPAGTAGHTRRAARHPVRRVRP